MLGPAAEPLLVVRRRTAALALPDRAALMEQARRLGVYQIWFSPVTWRAARQASVWALRPAPEGRTWLLERLEIVSASAGVGMGLCDPLTGRFLSVNGALCAFFERSAADLLACTWEQLTHPDDRNSDQPLAQQLQGGAINRYQLRKRFLRADGSTIWGDLVVACTRAADGSIRELIAQITDVSELVEKSTYLEAASSAGVVGVWDWDIANHALTWDSVMLRLYGLEPGAFSNSLEAWQAALHPDDKERVLADLEAAQRGWRQYQPCFRVIWPDGSIHWVQARSCTSYDTNGIARRMIGVNYDITEQVERQQEVEQQRATLAATQDALIDPLLFLTLECTAQQRPVLRIADVNPAGCALLGRSHGHLVGQPIQAVFAEAGNAAWLQALMEVCRQRVPWLADEYPLQLGEAHEPLYVDVRAVASRDGVVLSFRDVSERRRDALRLAESEERFRLLAENTSDAVFLNTEGLMRWMSPAITPMLGWQPEDWIGHSFVEFCHPDDIDLALQRRAEINAGATRVTRLRLRDRAGQWRWVEVHSGPYRNPAGEQVEIAGAMRTVDQEVAAEVALNQRARTDALTGLLNRKEILERQIGRAHV